MKFQEAKDQLHWKPGYNHSRVKTPPDTQLTVETAYPVYVKLKPFLAREKEALPPAVGWERSSRHLFEHNGWHYAVEWKPRIETGWVRLTYQEFCLWYGIGGKAWMKH